MGMKKIFIVFVLLVLVSGVEAQQFLNRRSIDSFMDKVREFTKDNNSYYGLVITITSGDGKYRIGDFMPAENFIETKYDDTTIGAAILYLRKQSFILFGIAILKISAEEAEEIEDNNPLFSMLSDKTQHVTVFGRSFKHGKGFEIVDSVEQLFKSLGF